jgi:hypothetical protein
VDSSTLAPEQLETVLRGLDVLIKVTRFYPPEHPALKIALEKNFNQCRSLLADGQPLTLTIHKAGFAIDTTTLTFRNAELKKFATQLFARQIRTLLFLPDLNALDLQNFVRCLSLEPQELLQRGGAQTLLQEAAVATLWVNEINLTKIYEQKKVLEHLRAKLAGRDSKNISEQSRSQSGPGSEKQKKLTLEQLLRELEATESDQQFQWLAKELEPLLQQNLNDAGRLQVVRALQLLCRYVEDERFSVVRRQTAGELLALLGRDPLLDFLVQSLCSKNLPEGTHEQLFSLFLSFKGKVEYRLVRRLSAERDAQCRKIFGIGLIRLGSSAVPALIEALADSRWFVVRNVIYILGEIRDRQVAASLVPFLAHEELRVRRETIRALTKIGGDGAESLLLQLLASDEEEMRRQAILFLGAMKCKAAIPALLSLTKRRDPKRRRLDEKKEAINALGQIGDEAANAQLWSILGRNHFWSSTKNEELRVAAALALGDIGSQDSLPRLRVAAEDRSGAVARAARIAIQRIEKIAGHAS